MAERPARPSHGSCPLDLDIEDHGEQDRQAGDQVECKGAGAEDEEPVLDHTQHARQHGIETVFQDLALVDELSVYHNLFLNREHTRGGWFRFLRNRAMRAAASRFLDDIGVDIPSVDTPVAKLSGGQRQAIAVARAVRQENIKILLLDEPLAAMGAKERSLIIRLIKSLSKKANISIIVIDHNYTHLFEICDRINVIQHG